MERRRKRGREGRREEEVVGKGERKKEKGRRKELKSR